MAERTLLLLFCIIAVTSVIAENQENFYPFGDGKRDNYLQRANDVSSPEIHLRFGYPFFNKKYWTIYVNDNGVISFNNPYTKYNGPQPVFPIGDDTEDPQNIMQRILVAPYWANVDMTQRGYVFYRQSTEQELLDKAAGQISKGFIEWDDYQPQIMIIATWMEVGFYGDTGGRNKRNSFQCVIVTDQFETFVIFIYDLLEWTTGVESDGRADTGIGGTPAQVGFNAGDGAKSWSHQYSRDGNFLFNLAIESNIEEAGVWVYHVSSVSIDIGGCTTAGEVKTFPRFDSMLGHQFLYLQGPCFTFEDEIWIRFGEADNPVAVTNCTWMSSQRAWCIVPTFFQVGRVNTYVSVNGAVTFPFTGKFDIVDIGDVPQGVRRINPQGEGWMLADRPVAIEWDPTMINYTQVNIDVMTYSETDGMPSWEETEDIGYDIPNTGRYEWIPRASGLVKADNAVGVIRITRRWKKQQNALWSDVHWLGYLLNDKFQRSPDTYSNQQCENWYQEQIDSPVWNYKQDLNPCPCDLSQAMADRARFRPLDQCNMDNAGLDDKEDYCYLREGIKHCVIDIINSPQTADSVCCYDYEENLVYAGDSFSGSFARRVTVNGVYPYNAVRKVPQMSTWLYDLIPWYFCCVWGDLCMYYQEYRPTRDCRWYQPPRMGVAFGDPHFVTFDGVEYTFNGKGEYTLFRSTAGAQARFLIQIRTEQMPDWAGNTIQATRLTSIVMKEKDRENIEIQHSAKNILQVVYQGEYMRIDRQTRLTLDGFFVSFPKKYEMGNITQVVLTFLESKVGVVINGTTDGMFVQVVIPYEYRGYVEGLLGNWNENPDDDLTSNGGTIVNPNSTSEIIYNQFGKSWEINTPDSLFLYEQGQNHDYFQDNDFIPAFDAPPSSLPPYLSSQDVQEVCSTNPYCIYDVQSTGSLLFGKATKKAYDDYKSAQRALRKRTVCQYIKTPKNGTKTFLRERNHYVGAEVEFRCDENFIPIGPEYRVCQSTGDWSGGVQEDDIVNECLESMVCGGLKTPPHGSITAVDSRPESIEVVYTCDIGYRRFGRKYRHCRQEFERWKGFRPGCYQKMNPLEMALAIVGGVVGAIIIVGVIVFVFVWANRKDRKEAQKEREQEMFKDIEMMPTSSTSAAPYHKGPPPASDAPDVQYGKPSTSKAPTTHRVTADPAPYRPAPDPAPYRPAPDPQAYPPPVEDDTANRGYASESWA